MNRLPDWEARLTAYLAERNAVSRFGYDQLGDPDQDDCCTFSSGAVRAMTGIDPMAEFRGHYRTARGAALALRRHGAGTLEATLDTKFGRLRPAFARRGDLAFLDGRVGICIGGDALFVGSAADGTTGLVRFPRHAWSGAWAI